MGSHVLVYADTGAWISPLVRALVQDIDPAYVIRTIGARHILDVPDLFDDAALLIMPGGADRPYCQALDGKGNARIRSFVEHGGTYFGICAGGYYASARIAWHRSRPDEISEPRELAFFQGSAIGSIPEFGRYYDMTKQSASAPRIALESGESLFAYYNGGPYYAPDPDCRFRAIASYADLPGAPIAIVETDIGKGRALLSGVHLEVSADELAIDLAGLSDGARYDGLVASLRRTEPARRSLWRTLLGRCGVAVAGQDQGMRKAG